MATKTSTANEQDTDMDDVEDFPRTDPIDVTDQMQSLSLLAAWRGVYNFFKGRVSGGPNDTGWSQDENGNVIAHNFTVDATYNTDTILRDISGRDRRIDFPIALQYFQGTDPEPYTDGNEMQNFMVNFTKGSAETGTAKTPEYVRKAVAAYKSEIGLPGRRGRKRSIIRLDSLDDLSPDALSGRDPAELDRLIEIATAARAQRGNTPAPTANA